MNLRHLLIPLALFCIWLTASAQTGTIKGRVTDRTGESVIGADITVLDSAAESLQDSTAKDHVITRQTTGSDGRYTITGLMPGCYLLRLITIGYCKQILPVVVNADRETPVDLKLTEGGVHIMENVISVSVKHDLYHEPSRIAPGKSLILGTVRDAETRHPVAFAYITVSYEYRKYADKDCFDVVEGCCLSIYADSLGRFGLSDLFAGQYRLSCSVSDSSYARGYREIATQPDSVQRVDLTMAKISHKK